MNILFTLIGLCSAISQQNMDTIHYENADEQIMADSVISPIDCQEEVCNFEKEEECKSDKNQEVFVYNDNRFLIAWNKKQTHLCGFYYGFVNTTGNDYSNYDPSLDNFMDMDWSGSFMMTFNIIGSSISLNPSKNIRAVFGMGLDYYRYKLSRNYTSIYNDNGKTMPYQINKEEFPNVRRSTFKNLYLTIPIGMEFNFPTSENHNIWASVGITSGFRLHSKTKIVYNNGHKRRTKETDNFNMNPYKGDVVVKLGFDDICLWGNYTFTNLFQHNKGPEMTPYAIGIGLIFGDSDH